ncbi:MAG: MAPEG family protein, partial [Novosphingobium sp.]
MKVAEILQPAVALMIWTMVMWLWMYATRIPAMNAVKLDPDSLARDPTRTLDDILPAQVQWKAHNY